MDQHQFDIIINGGGLVGTSAALALTRLGFRVALIESATPDRTALPNEQWDARIFAISPINRLFLQSLNAWPSHRRIGTIHTMQIMTSEGGQLDLSAKEADIEALAWVIEQRRILSLLWDQLIQSSVTLFTKTKPIAYHVTQQKGFLTLYNGQILTTQLLIGADGANSWVRKQSALPYQTDDYQQTAIVANFACETPHQGIARQWFFGTDILAWLPLPGRRFSMVWCTPDAHTLLRLDRQALAQVVAKTGKHQLGTLRTITDQQAFPLYAIKLITTVADRIVLIGDAAHLIHPLAGQGVNIGLRDVQQLVYSLSCATDPGNLTLLRHFSNRRLLPVKAMHYTCDGLYRLFGTSPTGLSRFCHSVLNRINHIAPLKRQLIKLATQF
ncbi:MAG: FAD-dependent monooxygenase [Neisseriales bacterium]|nr:MAG: FAD-dependent monooxygenase [Neisseriales bacterium]